jgi:excisionase family DNA binding protein
MSAVDALLAELSDDAMRSLADRLAPLIADRLEATQEDRWMNSEQAAEYLGCGRSRVHDLVQLRKLIPSRDGRSLRFRQSDLDHYLDSSR